MSAPTPLTYNSFVVNLANMAVVGTTTVSGIVQGVDDWFTILIPQALDYAELRIQRDLDLNALTTSKTGYAISSGTNTLTIPLTDFVVVETVQVTPNAGGSTTPLTATGKAYIQAIWGNPSATGLPVDFAPYGGDFATQGNTSFIYILGPYADQNYTALITGLARAASLYANSSNQAAADNNTTFISQWLPDLLLQAAMQFVSQYQRNFGAGSNDPNMPGSYEAAYQNLLKGALVEEARRKWQSQGWGAEAPALIATPSRG